MKRLNKWLALRQRTLPLRLWLALAVVAVTGAGFLAQVSMTVVVSAWQQQAAAARQASVEQVLGSHAARWRDPAWQQRTQGSLDDLAVDVAVFQTRSGASGEVGSLLFATAGAKRLWASASVSGATAIDPLGVSEQPTFQRIVITDPVHGAPIAIAFLWYNQPLGGGMLSALWALVELGAFMVTLAIVVWIIGLPVLRPLAAMSQAAEDIAAGDLSVRLEPTPVREIADVATALESMSAALRTSLASRAALEEQRRLFVSAIAHDLRTPLFMLRGYLMGLERGVATTPEKVAHYVDGCRIQADALERLIADLFAYTRLEYLEEQPERVPLELGATLREAVAAAQPVAAAKAITLATDSAEPCPIIGDGRLLARAVENVLDNALRYTPAGGEVWVRWRRAGDTVVFSVEDSGPGIAPHDLPRLFTPLYRGEASRNRQTGGAGLGLTIAQRILRAHGGELTAANRREGGAVFTGVLPRGAQIQTVVAPRDVATTAVS